MSSSHCRKSRRQRQGHRRRGRSAPRGLHRPHRIPRWKGKKIAELLAAYEHDHETLALCARNFAKKDLVCLKSAVHVFATATAPFYRACSSVFPTLSWVPMINILNISDNISWEANPSFGGGQGLHFRHSCTFGIGGVEVQGVPHSTDGGHDQDERTCTVTLDLFTQSDSFRGVAALENLDVCEAREVMHVKGEISVGGHIVSDTALIGGGIGCEDLFVDSPGSLSGIARSAGCDPTPEFARNFSAVLYCMLKTLVGRKWGNSAHAVLSRLIFIDEGFGLHVQVPSIQSYEAQWASDTESICSSVSDLECCVGRWYAAEHSSREAKIAQIIFQYIEEPEDVWRSVRFHLTPSEVGSLARGIDILFTAVDFYTAARTDFKLQSIRWISSVTVQKVSCFVENEVKGSQECSYQCDIRIGANQMVALCINGSFSKAGGKTLDLRFEGKRSKDKCNSYTARLMVNADTMKVLRTEGRVDNQSMVALVAMNRSSLRALRQELSPGMKMESFIVQLASVLWEILKGTTSNNKEFKELMLRNRSHRNSNSFDASSREKKRASSLSRSLHPTFSPRRLRTFSQKS